MPRYRIQTPEGNTLVVEGDAFPTEQELDTISQEMFPLPQRPALGPESTIADVIAQPKFEPVSATQVTAPDLSTLFAPEAKEIKELPAPKAGTVPQIPEVVQTAKPGDISPHELVPAIRLVGGQVVKGEWGDTHPDIIKRHGLTAENIDQRGFMGKDKFWPRIPAADATQIDTKKQEGELHSTDLQDITRQQVPRTPEELAVQRTAAEQRAPAQIKDLLYRKYGGYEAIPEFLRKAPLPTPGLKGQIGYAAGAPFAILEKEAGGLAADLMEQAFRIVADTDESKPAPFRNFMAAVMEAPEEPLPREKELGGRQDWEGAIQSAIISAGRLGGAILGAEVGGIPGRLARVPFASQIITPAVFGAGAYTRTQDLGAAMESAGMGAAWPLMSKATDVLAGQLTKKLILNQTINQTQATAIEQAFKLAGMQALMHGMAASEYGRDPANWRNTFATSTAQGLMFAATDIVKAINPRATPLGVNEIRKELDEWLRKAPEAVQKVFSEYSGGIDPKQQEQRVNKYLDYYEKQYGPRKDRALKPQEASLLELKRKIPERIAFENQVLSEGKKTGRQWSIENKSVGPGAVGITRSTGEVRVNRGNLHRWFENQLKAGVTPEQAAKSFVAHEEVHGASRSMKGGDAQAWALWRLLSPAAKYAISRIYPSYKVENGRLRRLKMSELNETNMGHEAIRIILQKASSSTMDEFLDANFQQRMGAKFWVGFLKVWDKIDALQQKRAMSIEGMGEILNRVRANMDATRKGVTDASKVTPTTAVHGDVRAQPLPRAREVPVEGGGPRVLTQAEGRVAQEVQVPLEPKAPPAAPTEGGPPAAPAPAPEVTTAKPAEVVKAPAAEPVISQPTAVTKEAQVKPEKTPSPEQVRQTRVNELRDIMVGTEKTPGRELTADEMDEMDRLLAGGKAAPAMRMKHGEDIAKELGLEYRGTIMNRDQYAWVDRDEFGMSRLTVTVPEGSSADVVRAKLQERINQAPAMQLREREEEPFEIRQAREVVQQYESGTLSASAYRRYRDAKDQVTRYDEQAAQTAPAPAMKLQLITEEQMDKLPLAEQGTLKHNDGMEYGLTLNEQDVPRLEQKYKDASQEMMAAFKAGENAKQVAAFGKMNYFGGALMGATRGKHPISGSNFERYMREREQAGQAPAMRLRDMTEEEFQAYLTPVKLAAGDDPVKQAEAVRAIEEQLAREDEAEFEAKQPKESDIELGLGPEEVPTMAGTRVQGALESYLLSDIGTKALTRETTAEGPVRVEYDRPSFKGFVRAIKSDFPGVSEDSLRWIWAEKVHDHLINASGKRLEDWRKALKLEGKRKFGTRPVADPPQSEAEKTAEVIAATAKMTESEIKQYLKDLPKREASQQNYRRALIGQIYSRLSQEALKPTMSLTRRDVGLGDIDFFTKRTSRRLAPYHSFGSIEGRDMAFLQANLDEDARVKGSPTVTRTKRLTVLVNRKTGSVEMVSTYRHPRSKEIMVYDPILAPSADKPHHRLKDVINQYRVKASILLTDPVQNFHQRFTEKPEFDRSAEEEFMDQIGNEGEARGGGSEAVWLQVQRDIRAEEAEEFEPPEGMRPEDVEERAGELPETAAPGGGLFVGEHAEVARSDAGLLKSNLKYMARRAMTAMEAEGIAKLFEEMDVRKFSDVKRAIEKLYELRQKRYWTGERRGLRGWEYSSLSGIDKSWYKHFLRLKQDPTHAERLKAIKDPEAREKYLEGIRIEALYYGMRDLYEIAEKHKTKYTYGGEEKFDINHDAFATEVLDQYGDHTRRAFEQAPTQEVSPTARELTVEQIKAGVPRVRARLLPQVPPGGRREVTPPERLAPTAEWEVRRQAEAKHGPRAEIPPGALEPFETPKAKAVAIEQYRQRPSWYSLSPTERETVWQRSKGKPGSMEEKAGKYITTPRELKGPAVREKEVSPAMRVSRLIDEYYRHHATAESMRVAYLAALRKAEEHRDRVLGPAEERAGKYIHQYMLERAAEATYEDVPEAETPDELRAIGESNIQKARELAPESGVRLPSDESLREFAEALKEARDTSKALYAKLELSRKKLFDFEQNWAKTGFDELEQKANDAGFSFEGKSGYQDLSYERARQYWLSAGPSDAPAMRLRGMYGMAERVREEMAREGRTIMSDPGIGITPVEAAQRGEELFRQGKDPRIEMVNMEETKAISEDGMALAFFWGRELQKTADRLVDAGKRDTEEYRRAFRESFLWAMRFKKQQTIWSKIGMVQQAVQDVDTGSFTSMQEAFRSVTKREFTRKQAAKAERLARKVRESSEDEMDAVEELTEEANKPEPMDPQTASLAQSILAWAGKTKQDALARIRQRRAEGRMFSAATIIPPEDLVDYAAYGAATMVEMSVKGGVKFSSWSKRMVKDIGDFIKPHLKQIWDEAEKVRDQQIKTQVGAEPAYEPARKVATRVDPTATIGVDEVRKIMGTKRPGKPTPQQARAVWNYIRKEYVDKGQTDFLEIRRKAATDLGMSVQELTEAMAASKTLKRMTDAVYKRMDDRRRVINEARNWLKNQKYPKWKQFFRSLPRWFFIDKVFGHGTVGLITHAAVGIFNPWMWKSYFQAWPEMYKMVRPTEAGTAYHERRMQDLQLDPLYITARRAGLQNNPFRYTDDYQVVALTRFFGKMIGNRGFDALKILRQSQFNRMWNDVPQKLRTDEMARLIADTVNHSTGIVKTRAPEWMNWTFFAPKLEGSRWALLVGDTWKAAQILAQPGRFSPEEHYWAASHTKQLATMVGMYFGALMVNQGLLYAVQSVFPDARKQKINFFDPRKSDFWAFKIAGFKVGVVSPMIGMARMLANLIHITTGRRKGFERIRSRAADIETTMGDYARGKLSPIAGFSLTAASQADYMRRPVPWSHDPSPAYMRHRGMGRYTWPEYLAESFAPIPLQEGIREGGKDTVALIKEVWKGQGIDEKHIEKILRGLSAAGVMAATGARVQEDPRARRSLESSAPLVESGPFPGGQ